MNGQLIHAKNSNAVTGLLHLGNLREGLYLVKVSIDNQSYSTKIIKYLSKNKKEQSKQGF